MGSCQCSPEAPGDFNANPAKVHFLFQKKSWSWKGMATKMNLVVVSNIFYFPYLGKMIQFDEHIFQVGGNHQLVKRSPGNLWNSVLFFLGERFNLEPETRKFRLPKLQLPASETHLTLCGHWPIFWNSPCFFDLNLLSTLHTANLTTLKCHTARCTACSSQCMWSRCQCRQRGWIHSSMQGCVISLYQVSADMWCWSCWKGLWIIYIYWFGLLGCVVLE